MHQLVIIEQILILTLLAVIGIVAAKFKVIDACVKDSIAKLVFNITLPLLIYTSVTRITLSQELLINSLLVFLGGGCIILALFGMGELNRRWLHLKSANGNVHVIHTMFGNVAFLRYPLFSALFPNGEGLFYAVIYHFTQDIFIWTLGVVIFQKGKKLSLKEKISHLLNPNTLSFAIGLLSLLAGFKLPELLNTPLTGMGKATIYLAMLYVGAVLYQESMKSVFLKLSVYVLGITKLLLIPLVFLGILLAIRYFTGISFSYQATVVLLMQAGMPCMTMIVVLAKKFKSDDVLATQNFFLTSIMSLITLPLLYQAINYFYFQ